MGFEVAGCLEDGTEALEWLESHSVDLVVTDIVMCNMSGLELARALWERGYPARVVLLSAYGEFDYARQGIAYGVAAYLLKPVRHEELLTVLNETASALENRRRIAACRSRTMRTKVWCRAWSAMCARTSPRS